MLAFLAKLKRAAKYKSLYYLGALQSRLLVIYLKRASPNRLGAIRHCLPGMLVVSLTSYPKRFGCLSLTIKSLLRQNTLPDKLILWIAETDKHLLPNEVLDLQQFGLTIAYCADIRSYKKLIPTLELFPEAFVVTADDDLYFGPCWLKHIVTEYSDNQKAVICYRAHRVKVDKNNLPLPYRKWGFEEGGYDPSPLNFPTTGAGVLFPPNIFHPSVLDIDNALLMCPTSDDVWFYWMLRLNGVSAKVMHRRFRLIEWSNSQDGALWRGNVFSGANDQAIKNMCSVFGFQNN